MKIVACIKQVPSTQSVKLNSDNNIIREGVEAEINPFDSYAVEEALKIAEQLEAEVTTLSMGIPSTVEILKRTVAMGADRGILLTDRKFAGADTLATAYTLSKAMQKIDEVDLIICGKQAVDGDTAQVGPSLADKLGIPHISCVSKILHISNTEIECERLIDNGKEIIYTTLPALITVVKGINTPRIPSLKGVVAARKNTITIWNMEDIDAEPEKCGVNGSPTQVVKTFQMTYGSEVEWIEGDRYTQVQRIISCLQSEGVN